MAAPNLGTHSPTSSDATYRLTRVEPLPGVIAAESVLVHLGRTYGPTGAGRAMPLPGDDIVTRPNVARTTR